MSDAVAGFCPQCGYTATLTRQHKQLVHLACGYVVRHFAPPTIVADHAALIVAHLDSVGAPLADFLDSVKPGDLDDLAAAVGITPAEATAAQRHLSAQEASA